MSKLNQNLLPSSGSQAQIYFLKRNEPYFHVSYAIKIIAGAKHHKILNCISPLRVVSGGARFDFCGIYHVKVGFIFLQKYICPSGLCF